MFCPKCGMQMDEGRATCPGCGAKVRERHTKATPNANNVYRANPKNHYSTETDQYNPADTQQEQLPMEWYKFLTKFALVAAAVLYFIAAFTYVSGTVHGDNADYMYHRYEGLQVLDVVYAIICIMLGIMVISARNKMVDFAAKGPQLFVTYLVFARIADIMRVVFESGIVGEAIPAGDMILPLIGTVIMVYFNKMYFEKRGYLFRY